MMYYSNSKDSSKTCANDLLTSFSRNNARSLFSSSATLQRSLVLASFRERRSSVLSIRKKVKKRSRYIGWGLAAENEGPEMTEIATLYLALHRGVVVADVLFNRGEKKAKRTQAGLPLEAFLETVEKNCYPLFLSELKGSF